MPDGVEATEAVMLCDMVTTGFHCAENAEIKPGETVTVVGLGPVGLMTCAGENLMGASEIYAVDCVDFRYEVANKYYGATHYINFSKGKFQTQINDLIKGRGLDKILIAGGGLATMGDACECLVNGGIVSNVNYLGSGENITIPRVAWNVGMGHKTLKKRGGGGLTPGGRYRMEKLARLLQIKKLDVKPILTHKLKGGLESIEQSLSMMKDKPAVEIQW